MIVDKWSTMEIWDLDFRIWGKICILIWETWETWEMEVMLSSPLMALIWEEWE